LSFNAKCGVVIGSNIDSDAIQIVLADMTESGSGKGPFSCNQRRAATPASTVGNRDRGDVEGVRTWGHAAAGRCGWGAGMTDVSTGTVIEAANLDEWRDVPALEILQGYLKCPGQG